jgi:hypothetical protein
MTWWLQIKATGMKENGRRLYFVTMKLFIAFGGITTLAFPVT